ncbi:MAG: peptidoglycan-binding protein [Paracoccaceae bacterium]
MPRKLWKTLTDRPASVVAALIVTATLAVSPMPAVAGMTAFKQAVAEFASPDAEVAAFYRETGFAPFWTADSADGLARRQALIDAYHHAGDHGLPAAQFDPNTLLSLMAEARGGRALGKVEVALSRAYLEYAHAVQSGLLTPARIDKGLVRKVPKRSGTDLLELVATGPVASGFDALPPQSAEYAQLLQARLRLQQVVARGGWGDKVSSGALKPGQSGKNVVALRNRLIRMGYLSRQLSTTYDTAMQRAVQQFQQDHGLEPDGVAGSPPFCNKAGLPPMLPSTSALTAIRRARPCTEAGS